MIQLQKHCWTATNIAMKPTKEIWFLWPKICCENGLFHVTVASSPKPDWNETGKGSRLFWWPAQPFLLHKWAEATGLCSKLSTQVTLDNFHSLQENCCIVLLRVSLVPGILPELRSLIISSSPSRCPHTCINNGDYSWVLSYFGSSFLEDKIRNLLLLLMLLISPAKSSPPSLLLSWVFSNVCFPST